MTAAWDEPLLLAFDGGPFPPHHDTDPALEPAPEKWTERRVLDALEDHFTRATGGNGERYVFARHVRTPGLTSAARGDAEREAAKIERAARRAGVHLDELTLDEQARQDVLASLAP